MSRKFTMSSTIVLTCVICGESINTIRECHNPWPYPKELYAIPTDTSHSYHCCMNCNISVVIRARTDEHFYKKLLQNVLVKLRKEKLNKINEKM